MLRAARARDVVMSWPIPLAALVTAAPNEAEATKTCQRSQAAREADGIVR